MLDANNNGAIDLVDAIQILTDTSQFIYSDTQLDNDDLKNKPLEMDAVVYILKIVSNIQSLPVDIIPEKLTFITDTQIIFPGESLNYTIIAHYHFGLDSINSSKIVLSASDMKKITIDTEQKVIEIHPEAESGYITLTASIDNVYAQISVKILHNQFSSYIGSWESPYPINSIEIVNNYIFALCDNHLFIIDIHKKNQPNPIRTIPYGGQIIHIKEDYAFIAKDSSILSIQLYNPDIDALVQSIETKKSSNDYYYPDYKDYSIANFVINNDLIIIATKHAHLIIFDISVPSDMKRISDAYIGSGAQYSTVHDIASFQNYVITYDYYDYGLNIYDITSFDQINKTFGLGFFEQGLIDIINNNVYLLAGERLVKTSLLETDYPEIQLELSINGYSYIRDLTHDDKYLYAATNDEICTIKLNEVEKNQEINLTPHKVITNINEIKANGGYLFIAADSGLYIYNTINNQELIMDIPEIIESEESYLISCYWTYPDGSFTDISNKVHLSVIPENYAEIDANILKIKSVSNPGTITVTSKYNGKIRVQKIKVHPKIQKLELIPSDVSLSRGQSQNFELIVYYTNGGSDVITECLTLETTNHEFVDIFQQKVIISSDTPPGTMIDIKGFWGKYNVQAKIIVEMSGVDWLDQFGTANYETGQKIAIDHESNIFVCGNTNGDLEGICNGKEDVWLAKYDNDGHLKWRKQFGSSEDDMPTSIAIDDEGKIYLTGWTKGSLTEENKGDVDIWLYVFNSNGQIEFQKQFGTEKYDTANKIFVDHDKNIYLAGRTNGCLGDETFGEFDAWLGKYDSKGNIQWINQFGTDLDDNTASIKLSLDKQYLIAAGEMDQNVWIARYSLSGNCQWIESFGTSEGNDSIVDILLLSSGNIIIGGNTDWGVIRCYDGIDCSECPWIHYFGNEWRDNCINSGYCSSVYKNKDLPDDSWLAEFHSDGTFQTAYKLEDASAMSSMAPLRDCDAKGIDDRVLALAIDTKENCFFALDYDGKPLIVQYNTQKDIIALDEITSDAELNDLIVDTSGNLFSTGSTYKLIATQNLGSNDVWIAKYKMTGRLKFSNDKFYIREDGVIINPITISRVQGTIGEISAIISISDGNATFPEDYINDRFIQIRFNEGETEKIINLSIVNDNIAEHQNESISLKILQADNNFISLLGKPNEATVYIIDDDIDHAGNTINDARLVDTNEHNIFVDKIDQNDLIDYYQILLPEGNNAVAYPIEIQLKQFYADLDIEITKEDGSIVLKSDKIGRDDEKINLILPSAKYYIKIYSKTTVETTYTLQFSKAEVIDDLAGNNTETALDLFFYNETINISESLNPIDQNDFYQLFIEPSSCNNNLLIRFEDLNELISFQLMDIEGQVIEPFIIDVSHQKAYRYSLNTDKYYLNFKSSNITECLNYKVSLMIYSSLNDGLCCEALIDDSNDKDVFTFDVLKGDQIILYAIDSFSNSYADLYIYLYDPDSNLIGIYNDDDPQKISLVSEMDGQYKIHTFADTDYTGKYKICYSNIDEENRNGAWMTISDGQSITSTIDYPGDKDVVTFNALKGDHITLYAIDSFSNRYADLYFSLYDPDSNEIGTYNDDDPQKLSFILEKDGQYKIHIFAESNNSGEYKICYSNIDEENRNGTGFAVLDGQSITTNIDYPGDKDVFTFEVKEGDRIDIYAVDNFDSSGDLYLELYQPDGTKIKTIYKNYYQKLSFISEMIGKYQLHVYAESGYTGEYKICYSNIDEENRNGSWLAISDGQTITTNIDYPGDRDLITFEVEKGDRIDLSAVDNFYDSGADLYLELYQPDGTIIKTIHNHYSQKLSFISEMIGQYQLHVYAESGYTGEYNLCYSNIDEENRNGSWLAISDGQTITTNIDYSGDKDVITFNALKGDQVTLSAIDSFSNRYADLYIDLYEPDGNKVGGYNDDDPQKLSFILGMDGQYKIHVFAETGNTGKYNLCYSNIDEENRNGYWLAVSDGQTITANIDYPGDKDVFTFEVKEDDRVDLYAADNFSDSRADLYLELFQPDGTKIKTSNSYYVQKLSFISEINGQYRLYVYAESIFTGEYQICYSNIDEENRDGSWLAISDGQTITTNIDYPGDKDVFTFEVKEGDRVELNAVDNFSDSRADLYLELLQPDGAKLKTSHSYYSQKLSFISEINGQYQLHVYAESGYTGEYIISFLINLIE